MAVGLKTLEKSANKLGTKSSSPDDIFRKCQSDGEEGPCPEADNRAFLIPQTSWLRPHASSNSRSTDAEASFSRRLRPGQKWK